MRLVVLFFRWGTEVWRVLFHPSDYITGMLWRWESSWSLSLSYTIPSHMMSFVLMRPDISTTLHDHSTYLPVSSNFCSNSPLHLCAPKCSINEWLFPLLHFSVIKLVLSLITGFHLPTFLFPIAFLTFSLSMPPPWSSLIWLIINSSDSTSWAASQVPYCSLASYLTWL